MHTDRDQQPLSYDVRLPDEAQADALRLLDASRAIVNALLMALWPRLDEFLGEQRGPAWKQMVTMTPSSDPHGDRQFRCKSETAGRILRAQAERRQVFELIRPILFDGFIRPKTEKRPAGKTARVSKKPSRPFKRCLRRTTSPLSPCKMWSNNVVITSSNRECSQKRMKRCRPFPCSKSGC